MLFLQIQVQTASQLLTLIQIPFSSSALMACFWLIPQETVSCVKNKEWKGRWEFCKTSLQIWCPWQWRERDVKYVTKVTGATKEEIKNSYTPAEGSGAGDVQGKVIS